MNKNSFAVIVAAGTGTRMKNSMPKQYLKLGTKPILLFSIEAFLESKYVNYVKVVISKSHIQLYNELISKINDKRLLPFSLGGENRTVSVLNGLNDLEKLTFSEKDKVLIHDAARPFISQDLITQIFCELEYSEAVFPKLPISDALWYINQKSVIKGPDRFSLFRAQTPQGFYFRQIKDLFSKNSTAHLDDISIAHENGLKISGIAGDPINIKLTNPEDLIFAEKVTQVWI